MRQLVVAGVIVLAIVTVGTSGYMLIEGWSLFDAFYMTIISISTTGYREVHPLSTAGQMFSVAVIILGLISVAYFGGRALQLVVESYLARRKGMDRKIRHLKNHYVVCGYGRMGRHIVQDLREAGARFVIVEREGIKSDELAEDDNLYIVGDSTDDEVLIRAGVPEAAGLITVVSSDPENVYTVLSAKALNPDIFIVARAMNDDTEPKLLKAGADRVIKPYEHVGHRMAQLLLRPNIVEFIDTVGQAAGKDIKMEEVLIAPGSTLVGTALRDSPIRQELNIIVVVVRRASGEFIYNPSSTLEFESGDRLISIGDREALRRLAELCTGAGRPDAGR